MNRMNRTSRTFTKYSAATKAFTTVIGGGTNGSCPDGTSATACDLDISDAFVDANGQVYYVERGRIRTIDQSGNIQTLMGSGLHSGDGGAATSARMGVVNDVKLWNNGASDLVVLADNTQFRIREFPIGGSINTIAGNGSNANPATT